MLESFNRGEYARSTGLLHEDAELHQPSMMPDAGTFIGKAEWVRCHTQWLTGFEPGFQYEIEELIDAEKGVFVRLTLRGVGRESGAPVTQPIQHLYEVRDGKVIRCRVFPDEREGRAAAGLS